MKLRIWRTKQPYQPQTLEGEDYEALKNERLFLEEQGSVNAIIKKMGRENLDGPFRQD
jgi:hypothetical protein